jgi:hypothetical protein
MQQDGQIVFACQFQLFHQQAFLPGGIQPRQVVIQSDFSHGQRGMLLQMFFQYLQVIVQMTRQVDGMQAKGNPAAIASRMARLSAKLSLWMDGNSSCPTPQAWAAATMSSRWPSNSGASRWQWVSIRQGPGALWKCM